MLKAFYKSKNHDYNLVKGDCIKILFELDFQFDMIFADPPYFLSNGGVSVQSGKQVSVNKGDWDKSQGFEKDNDFNRKACGGSPLRLFSPRSAAFPPW